jgi:hypothetical protein
MEEMKSVDAKYEMAITNLELELVRLVGQKDSMIEGVNKELTILGDMPLSYSFMAVIKWSDDKDRVLLSLLKSYKEYLGTLHKTLEDAAESEAMEQTRITLKKKQPISHEKKRQLVIDTWKGLPENKRSGYRVAQITGVSEPTTRSYLRDAGLMQPLEKSNFVKSNATEKSKSE